MCFRCTGRGNILKFCDGRFPLAKLKRRLSELTAEELNGINWAVYCKMRAHVVVVTNPGSALVFLRRSQPMEVFLIITTLCRTNSVN